MQFELIKNAAATNLFLGALSIFPAVISGILHAGGFAAEGTLAIHRNLSIILAIWGGCHLLFLLLRFPWLQNPAAMSAWSLIGSVLAFTADHFGGIINHG